MAESEGGVEAGDEGMKLFPLGRREADKKQSAFLIKLTDSSLRALKNAQKANKPLKISVELGGTAGELRLGDVGYRFVVNDMVRDQGQGVTQAVKVDSGPSETMIDGDDEDHWELIQSSLRQRISVKATDDTFAETKQKALQLQEEEQKKAGKELTGSGKPKVKVKTRTVPAASLPTTNKPKPPIHHPHSYPHHPPPPARPTGGSGGGNGGVPVSMSGSGSSIALATANRNVESKRTVRERVIHLLVLKAQTPSEIVERLSRQIGGLTEGDKRSVGGLLAEVGKANSSSTAVPGSLVLNPSLYKELDLNWPYSNPFDKQKVRRVLEGVKTATTSPPPPQPALPTHPPPQFTHSNKNSMPLDDLLPNNKSQATGRKRPSPPYSNPPSISPPSNLKSGNTSSTGGRTPEEGSPGTGKKSKLEQTKIPDYPSSSPPVPLDDPPNTPPPPPDTPPEHQRKRRRVEKEGKEKGGTDTNWEDKYPKVTSAQQRRNYYEIFERDYDDYMRFYRKLKKVSDEFTVLEAKLNKAPDGSKELRKVEKEIYQKYDEVKEDKEFQLSQRKHEELRGKLAVIKERVRVWDEKEEENRDLPSPHPHNPPLHDFQSFALF